MTATRRLSRAAARRAALRAQGLDRPLEAERHRALSRADIARIVARMGVLQIDSVNVLARAHYVPLFSRLGSYDTGLLHAATAAPPRLLLEQWGHEACFVPPTTHRLLAGFTRRWSSGHRIDAHPGAARLRERILSELHTRGPATAREMASRLAAHDLSAPELELAEVSTGHEWNRGAIKVLLENLFDEDVVTSAGRTEHFHRIYDLSRTALPPAVRDVRPAPRSEAIARLTELSIAAIGIGDLAAIADVFRLPPREVAPELDRLCASGELEAVRIEGIERPYYLAAALTVPRAVAGARFLSPFDPLIFFRPRALQLFGLDYRIGIYTPAAKRTRGYYSLPLLVDGEIVARADLALDRKTATVQVRGAWDEGEASIDEVRRDEAARAELERLATWLDATSIRVTSDAPGAAAARWRRW